MFHLSLLCYAYAYIRPAFKDATSPFSVTQGDTIPTIISSATKTVVSEDISCDTFQGGVLALIQYELEHQMSLIIVASGTFSPPSMTDFMIIDSQVYIHLCH